MRISWKEIRRFIAEEKTPNVMFRLGGGNIGVMAATNEAVEEAEVTMLLSIFGAITLLCLLTFRSWRAVLCIIVPLTIVSILCNALMARLGIGLEGPRRCRSARLAWAWGWTAAGISSLRAHPAPDPPGMDRLTLQAFVNCPCASVAQRPSLFTALDDVQSDVERRSRLRSSSRRIWVFFLELHVPGQSVRAPYSRCRRWRHGAGCGEEGGERGRARSGAGGVPARPSGAGSLPPDGLAPKSDAA
ncbi:hypothetical protein ACU4GD_05570 [Cupriavidus basilensis]